MMEIQIFYSGIGSNTIIIGIGIGDVGDSNM